MKFMQDVFHKFKNSKLFQGFSIYFGTSLINKALPFFLLPVLTRYLSSSEYGVLAVYQVLVAFSMPFVGMNMHNNITRNFFKQSHEYLAKLIFNLVLILFVTSSIFFVFIGCYIHFGGESFDIPSRWIYILPVLAMMNMINQFNLTIFRNQQRPFAYGIFEISMTLLNLSSTLVLVIIYFKGWEGRAGGMFFSTVVFGVISFTRLKKANFIIFKIDSIKIKEILKISLPLIPHSLGSAVITLSDRLFIKQMIGTDTVGVYSVGYQFGMILLLVVGSFSRSWSPWFHQKLAKPTFDAKSKIVKATYVYVFIIIILAASITVISRFLIPRMTTQPFYGASIYVGWVAAAYAFNGMYTMVFPYSVLVGKTSFMGLITFLGACFNLIGNYYLIKLNGSVGAAQSTLLSYMFMFVAVWWYSNRLFPMPWFKLKQTS